MHDLKMEKSFELGCNYLVEVIQSSETLLKSVQKRLKFNFLLLGAHSIV